MPLRPKFRRLFNSRNAIRYLLRDEFITPLPAGSVNGTPPEPGPGGDRTASDPSSKLSIANGKATFATGAAPGLWYPLVTRLAGRILTCSLTYTVAVGFEIGFDSDQTGILVDCFRGSGTGFQIRNFGGSSLTVGLLSAGTTYKFAFVQRAVGFNIFVLGGLYTVWSFLGQVNIGSADGYPGIISVNASCAFEVDYIRIPVSFWLPAPLASDGFGSVFGTTDGLGHAEVTGIGSGGVGKTWTHTTYSVTGAKAINTPGVGSELVANGNFSAWTAGNPDSWTVGGEVGSDPEISETGGGLHGAGGNGSANFYSTATVNQPRIFQSILTIGKWYRGVVNINSFGSGIVGIGDAATGVSSPYLTSGIKNFTHRSAHINFLILASSVAPHNFTIDDVSIKELTLTTLFASLSVGTADVMAEVSLVVSINTQAGMVLNLDNAGSPANFVLAYHDGTNAQLVKCVAGVYTSVISAAATYSSGAVLRISKLGTAWRLYYNNALVGSAVISDAGITSNTLHGLFSTYSGNTLDNFVVYASGSNNEYAVLDNY